jgi:hypothetical protein
MERGRVKGALDGSVLWVMDYGCFELRMSWIIYFCQHLNGAVHRSFSSREAAVDWRGMERKGRI